MEQFATVTLMPDTEEGQDLLSHLSQKYKVVEHREHEDGNVTYEILD